MKLYAAAFLYLSALSSCAAYDDAMEDIRLANRNAIYDEIDIIDIETMSKTGRILKKQNKIGLV